jgi:hypothetical protein
MMQDYYVCVSWIEGASAYVAFLLTFWTNRFGILSAATLWSIGAITLSGFVAYDYLSRGAFGVGFSSEPFPIVLWLYPLLLLAIAICESMLLFPWITKHRALLVGRWLLLIAWPCIVLFKDFPDVYWFRGFPLASEWVVLGLLWFRIRERVG